MKLTRTESPMLVAVRCTGMRWVGGREEVCDKLLARVEADRWEQDMASRARLVCPRCGITYSLAILAGLM